MAGTDLQGTVRTYDPGARSGEVMLDDGSVLAFGSHAFDVGGLRQLRPGQRVRLCVEIVDGATTVTALTLATFPWPK